MDNIDKYKKTTSLNQDTQKDIKEISRHIKRLADQYFPKEIKEWVKLRSRFDKDQLSLLDYLKRLSKIKQVGIEHPSAQLLLEADRTQDRELLEKIQSIESRSLFKELEGLENDLSKSFLTNERDQMIFNYYKLLGILNRLVVLEVSPAEYAAVKDNLKELRTEINSSVYCQRDRKEPSSLKEVGGNG